MCLKLCVALLNLGDAMVKTGNQPVGKIGGGTQSKVFK